MAIPDVHAIPETADACTEYQTEADQAWNDGNQDHAWDVYRSLFESHVKTDAQQSHVAHRLTLIAVNRGDTDTAWNYASYSNEPGIEEIRHSLDNATPNDATPDPDVVPTTVEQTDDWWTAGIAAKNAGDWDLMRRFFHLDRGVDLQPAERHRQGRGPGRRRPARAGRHPERPGLVREGAAQSRRPGRDRDRAAAARRRRSAFPPPTTAARPRRRWWPVWRPIN